MSGLYARLDTTTGLKVLCGGAVNTCRGELACIWEFRDDGRGLLRFLPTETVADVKDEVDAIRAGTSPWLRGLRMLDAWQPRARDGVWQEIEHSAQRARQAKRELNWGHITPGQAWRQGRASSRRRYETAVSRRGESAYNPARKDRDFSPKLPTTAICPQCGRKNILDAERLQVSDPLNAQRS